LSETPPNAPDPNEPNEPDPNAPDPNEPAPYTPPAEEEWTQVTSTLAKRKTELKTLRQELAALRAKNEPPKEGEPAPAGPPKADPELKVKRLAVVAALAGEGMTKDQAKVAARLVDLAEVDVDDDGDADLDDVISELKRTFPAMFVAESAGGPRPRPRTSGGRERNDPVQSSDDKHTASLLRSAGYK
jgi:glutaredoxin